MKIYLFGFLGVSDSKESACTAGDLISIPGLGRSPGEGNSHLSRILAWRIPRTEEPGGLQAMGLQRVGHDRATFTFTLSFLGNSTGKESVCNSGDPGSILGSGRSTGEGTGYPLQHSWASLVAQLVKNPPAMRRPAFDPWVGKIPWRRERLSTIVFWSGEFHGLDSSWGHKE